MYNQKNLYPDQLISELEEELKSAGSRLRNSEIEYNRLRSFSDLSKIGQISIHNQKSRLNELKSQLERFEKQQLSFMTAISQSNPRSKEVELIKKQLQKTNEQILQLYTLIKQAANLEILAKTAKSAKELMEINSKSLKISKEIVKLQYEHLLLLPKEPPLRIMRELKIIREKQLLLDEKMNSLVEKKLLSMSPLKEERAYKKPIQPVRPPLMVPIQGQQPVLPLQPVRPFWPSQKARFSRFPVQNQQLPPMFPMKNRQPPILQGLGARLEVFGRNLQPAVPQQPQPVLLPPVVPNQFEQPINSPALPVKSIKPIASPEMMPLSNSNNLLNSKEIELVKQYFLNNPNCKKIKRGITYNIGNEKFSLKFSVIKADDNKLFAMYRGKNKNLNPNFKDGILGRGSFGRVKLAWSLDLPHTTVAAKVQKNENFNSAKSIKEEEKIQAKVGQYVGSTCITIQKFCNKMYKNYTFSNFIEGENLYNFCSKVNLDEKAKLTVILNTLQALQELHKQNILHGDINLGNILVDRNNKCHFIDFGLAGVISNENSYIRPNPALKQRPFNSTYYAPIECYGQNGKYYLQSDIYSLGYHFQRIGGRWRSDFLIQLGQEMSKTNPRNRLPLNQAINKVIIEMEKLQKSSTKKFK